jgi:pSer/pThr/pTyr-binding forkhead associated (FHA) protein
MARLVVLSEGFTGLSYDLKVEKTTVGRVDDNAFQISEQSVSSHHCEILQRGNEFVVKDLGSTNGTFVNGEQVTESPLKPGQILRLGQVEIRLESGTGPAAAQTAAKKPLDKTVVIPQGVKVQELDSGARGASFQNTAFSRKTNKANKIFIIVGIVVFVLIVGLIIVAWFSLRS